MVLLKNNNLILLKTKCFNQILTQQYVNEKKINRKIKYLIEFSCNAFLRIRIIGVKPEPAQIKTNSLQFNNRSRSKLPAKLLISILVSESRNEISF